MSKRPLYLALLVGLATAVAQDAVAQSPSLVLSDSSLEVPEAGSASYTVKLANLPTADVTVSIGGTSGTDLRLDKTSLMFTTSNWNMAQGVTVWADGDSDATHDSATLTHTASGGGYDSVSADLPVTVTDITRMRLEAVVEPVLEGESRPIRARLPMPLDEDVTVTVAVAPDRGDHEYELSANTTLTIAAGATESTGEVIFTVLDDFEYRGTSYFNATLTPDHPRVDEDIEVFIITDDDTVWTRMEVTTSKIFENGGEATLLAYKLRLHEGVVKMEVSLDPSGRATLSGNTLTFLPGARYATETLTITAVDNTSDEADQTITISATVTEGRGITTPPPLELTIVDDDNMSPEVALVLTPPRVREGLVSTVTAVASGPLAAEATITVSASPGHADTTTDDYELSADTVLTIPASGTRSTGTVTIAPVDDQFGYPGRTVTVTVSGTVTGGGGVSNPTDQALTVLEDDPRARLAVIVTPSTIAEGEVSTITLRSLGGPLPADVKVTIHESSDEVELSADPVLMIAEGATESTGTVTLTAVQDTNMGNRVVSVSGVPDKTFVTVKKRSVYTIDDDPTEASLTVTPVAASFFEGETSTIIAALSRPLSNDVTVTIVVDETDPSHTATLDDYTLSGDFTLTIPAGGMRADGPTLTASNDEYYGSLRRVVFNIASVTGIPQGQVQKHSNWHIQEDESTPRVTLEVTAPSVSENNGQSTVTARLNTKMAKDVEVTISAEPAGTTESDDFTQAGTLLTIPADQKNSTGTVTIVAVDDDIDGPDKNLVVNGTVEVVGMEQSGLVWFPYPESLTIRDDDTAPTAVTLSLNPNAVGESAAATAVTVTAGLIGSALPTPTAVTVSVTGGTAVSVTDYAAVGSFTVTIPSGQTSATAQLSFDPAGDSLAEGDETVILSGSATGLTAGTATLTITDDDTAPTAVTLSLNPNAVGESAAATAVTVTAGLNGSALPTPTAVTVSVTGGTAVSVTDYAAVGSFTVTIPSGQTSATAQLSFDPAGDSLAEGDETVILSGSATGLTAGTATLTITDDDTAPTAVTLSLNPNAVGESAAATAVTVTAGLNGSALPTPTAVTVSVTGGTATSVTDYAAVSSFTVTIPSGQTSATAQLSFDPAGDSLAEGDETVILSGSATGLTAGTATLTITDDDTAPTAVTLSLNPNAVGESAAATAVTVTAGLNGSALPTPTAVTVSVTGGTAVSVTDYAAVSSFTVTIPSGQTSATAQLSFDPAEDSLVEGDETVILSGSATGLTAGTATLTITDNDTTAQTTVTFGASSYTASEGGAAATVAVDLSTAPSAPVTILLTKAHLGGATEADYSGVPLSVTFTAGQTRRTFTVTATDDSVEDGGERVRLGFRTLPVGFELGARRTATVALTDNDGGEEMVTVRFAVRAGWPRDGVEEGISYSFHFLLDRKPGRRLTIPLKYTYLYGATAGDFGDLPAAVTFGKNQRHSTVSVPAAYDFEIDPGEALRVSFGTLPAGVKVGSYSGPTTILPIVDTDGPPGLSVTDASAREWPGKRVCLVFVVKVDQHSVDHEVRVDYATADGTAFAGQDYKPVSGTLVFRAGQREKSLCVEVIYDSDDEGTEEMTLRLSNPVGAYLSDGTATGHISNKDRLAQGLSVAGPLLALGYPGALDAGSQPSPRDFVVAAEAPGGARAMVAVTAVTVRGSDVVLELDRPVTPDETVTLTYLAAAMHPIRDVAGLPAAPLADEPVRNDTGASGPLAEPGLAAGTAIPEPLAALLEAVQEGAGTERLDLSSRNLTDVSALAGLTGLQALDLRGNAITDLSPLAGLTGLRELDLSGNRIADLWPLAGLAALQRLDLADNRIADIATLAELTGLLALDLSGNRIADLWPLAGLAALQRLILADNRIADIATLAELTGLLALDLSGNRIADLWPLAGLAALERLNLTDNRIADLATLAGLSGLEVLLLDRNRVADVQALSQLAGLANLGLSDNRIADIGLLAELGGLRRLDLSGNAVADVSALGDVSGLVWLRLPGNPVSNAAPLGRLEKLRWLWLDSGTAPLWIERTSAR